MEDEIRQLVSTIRDLMRQSRTGWVYWNQVSRQQTGSAEFSDVLIALASLPDWQHLFVMTGGVVKLTVEGLAFLDAFIPPPLSDVQKIAKSVVHYAARLHDIWLPVHKVSKVAQVGNKVVQAVYGDLVDEPLPSESPVQLCSPGSSPTRGKIVGQEADGSVLYIAFESEILPDSLPAKLRIERGFLLNRLAWQIDSLPGIPDRMRVVLNGCSQGMLVADLDSLVVGKSLASVQAPWTRFLWGPPGAGKTFAIAHLAATLLQAEPQSKILVVAPSNRAVDVAVEQIVERLGTNGLGHLIEQRKILRYGYPRKSQIIDRPELLGPPQLDQLSREVKRLARQIENAEKEEHEDVQLAVIRAGMLAAQDAVKAALSAHISNASVIATTTTLAYLPASPISPITWNTILVDEVTMVTPAMCTFWHHGRRIDSSWRVIRDNLGLFMKAGWVNLRKTMNGWGGMFLTRAVFRMGLRTNARSERMIAV